MKDDKDLFTIDRNGGADKVRKATYGPKGFRRPRDERGRRVRADAFPEPDAQSPSATRPVSRLALWLLGLSAVAALTAFILSALVQ